MIKKHYFTRSITMKHIFIILIISLGVCFLTESQAKKETDKPTKVMIDLSPNQPAHKLFPLTILSVNGERFVNKSDMMMLEPGDYKLKFAANVNYNYLAGNNKILQTKINQRKYDDTLDLVVEANNIYHLAFDARSHKVEDWKPILLNVTERK